MLIWQIILENVPPHRHSLFEEFKKKGFSYIDSGNINVLMMYAKFSKPLT